MMIALEHLVFKSQELWDGMIELVRQASVEGWRVDEVERELFAQLMQLGFLLISAFVESAGDGDVGETLELPINSQPDDSQFNDSQSDAEPSGEPATRTVKRLPNKHVKRYVSIFGELSIERYVYGTNEKQAIEAKPLDAKLGLPAGDFSYVLEDWQQRLCVKQSFGEGTGDLKELLGVAPSVRAAEVMNRAMAEFVPRFQLSQPPPPPDEEEALVVFTSDCKGVPMRKPPREAASLDEAKASKHRLRPGEKANKKRMACVGAVYSIEPFFRTTDDVVDELARKEAAERRPVPQHKRVRAELTRMIEGEEYNGKVTLFGDLAEQARARSQAGTKTIVALMDGERALWNLQEIFLPEAVGVLDLFHVIEYLWDAAYVFHKDGSDEADDFVNVQLRRLLDGQVVGVIHGLKCRLGRHELSSKKHKALQTVITYFENNRAHMQYDEYLREGYPIGSGVAEGACRHLVKDRMEQTGMRWVIDGAQAMLHTRATYLNGDWKAFLTHRIEHEQTQLYPEKTLLSP